MSIFIFISPLFSEDSVVINSEEGKLLAQEILMKTRIKEGILDCALYLIETQKEKVYPGHERFTGSSKDDLLSGIAIGFAKSGKHYRALELAEKIITPGIKNETNSMIAEIKEYNYKYYDRFFGSKIKHASEILDLKSEIQRADTLADQDKAELLSNIVSRYATYEQFSEALSVLKKIEDDFPFLKTKEPDFLKDAKILYFANERPVYENEEHNVRYHINSSYYVAKRNILGSYLSVENFREALQTFEIIEDPLMKARLLAGSALSYAQEGDKGKARGILLESLALLTTGNVGPYDTVIALVFIDDKYNRVEIPIDDEVKNILEVIVANLEKRNNKSVAYD